MGKNFDRSYEKSYILLPLSRLLLISLVFSISLLFFACAALADDIDITMGWNANTETDLAGYRLYYRAGSFGPPYNGTGATEGDSPITIGIGNPNDPNNPVFTLADPNNPVFTLSGLDDTQNWFFVVTAYDTSNNESGYSNQVSYSGTNQPPSASFSASPTSGVAPLMVNFDASGSYDPDGNIVSYAWNFGDGATGNGATASHTYTSGNTFTVMLTVTDNAGASGSTTDQVQVSAPNQGPTASFAASPTSGVAPLVVNFDASDSYDPDGNIVSYTWNFGDGATGTGSTVGHTYTSDNTFTVTLTVTDNDGAGASTTGQVQVSAPNQGPTASFSASPSSGLAPLTVDFDASGSYDPDGSIVSYTWNFGDGATGTGSTVSHEYTSGGIYDVSLTVTDNSGATDTGTRQILVTTASNLVPDTPVLYLPVDGAANESCSPNLETESFIDPDGDTHAQTQWQISGTSNFSSLVFGKTSNFYLSSLTVPTSVLDENNAYYWRVRFYDDRGGESAWSLAYSFTTEVSVTDTNPPNGVPDTQEVDGTVDVDNNGILDLDQMLSDIRFKCMNTFSGDKQLGFEGITNVASIDSVMSIDPDTIPDKPGGLPFGLISIKLRTINPGDTVEVVVYFSEQAPEGTRWYKYDSLNGWQDYSAYATFSADRKSLVLELKDGGHGDSDGVENGIIVDPGGVVGSTGGVDSGGGGGGCFIATAAFGS